MSLGTQGPPGERRVKLANMIGSPALFLRDVDPIRDKAVLSPMSEASYRASSFLDNRLVRAGGRDMVVGTDALIRVVGESGLEASPIHYIFHVGHCGSTLIARLMGELEHFFALRAPVVLMGLARSYRALGESGFPISRERWSELRDLALTLLSRTWRPDQSALVKPSSHAANLIPELMSFTGKERALLLYVDLETYMATMIRPHLLQETQLYARDFRLKEFRRLTSETDLAAEDLSDARLIAMSWLLQTRELAVAAQDPLFSSRTTQLSFDDYLRDPSVHLGAICEFMGYPTRPDVIEELVSGETAHAYAKAPQLEYDVRRRTNGLDKARRKFETEIADALDWAGRVCDASPVFEGLIDRFS